MIRTLDRSALALRARSRPFGVYVMAALQALNAISHGFGVFAGFEDSVLGSLPGLDAEAVAVAETLAGLLVAAGLLLLARWAWIAAMLWVGAIMAIEISFYLSGDDANFAVMAISVAQVFYLNQSDVQAAFRRARQVEGTVV